MTWGETHRLAVVLASDPTSQVAVALGKLGRPTTFIELMLMDLYDLTHQIPWAQNGKKGSKPKPYPRPAPTEGKRFGTAVPIDELQRVLAAHRAQETETKGVTGG